MIDIADIKDVSLFAEQLGETFRIEVDSEQTLEATLVEAEALAGKGAAYPDHVRKPFALIFELPDEVTLPQRTYTVSQESIGELPLFLVPVGPSRMESIFN